MEEVSEKIHFGEFELDRKHRRLLRRGEPVPIYAKTFDLLEFLVTRNGSLITKDEILENVWPDQIVEEANLSVQVSALRKALGERKEAPCYLLTMPGKGYKFVADVTTADTVVIENHRFSRTVVHEETSIDDSEPPLPLKNNKSARLGGTLAFVALSVAIVASIAGAAWWFVKAKDGGVRFSEVSIKQLTDRGNINWAIISPDGKFFAYTTSDDKKDFRLGLWLAQTDGSNEIQILAPEPGIYRGLAFSRDGKTLYFCRNEKDQSYQGSLYRMPVLGGVPERLAENIGEFLSVSPDDRSISFFRPDKQRGVSSLILLDLSTRSEREVASRPSNRSFSSHAPAWSPDGTMLAVAAVDDNRNEEFFSVNVSDGTMRQITTQGWRDIVNLVWQPDGSSLLAVAKEKGSTENQLWQIDIETAEATRITRDTDTYGFPISVSSDSRSLLVTQGRTESNIWAAPSSALADGRQITFSSIGAVYGWFGLDFSPDGRIFFIGAKDQSRVLYVADADGGNIKQITNAGFFDQKPSVSPDGSFIAFQSNRSGKNEIWRVAADGSDLRQLTSTGMNTSPHVSPDGKSIVYVSGRFGETAIWMIQSQGGEPVRLTDRQSFSPRFSPDGKFVACFFAFEKENRHQIAILPSDGGEPVKLFDVPKTANLSLDWSPDGSAVYYRDWVAGVWKQDLSGSEPEKVSGLPDAEILSFAWSRDAQKFAYTRGRTISDVVLITSSGR